MAAGDERAKANIVIVIDDQPSAVGHPPYDPRPPMAMAVMVSQAEQDWINRMRLRPSYELAVARGHIMRSP